MTEENSEITLQKLMAEIDQHVPRIRTRASSVSASGSAASAPMLELSGTVLPILRDLVAYVAMLETAVIRTSEDTAERLDQIEDGLLSSSSQENGTQFDPEDAEKFNEFLTATKILLESLVKEAANPEPVRKQIEQMISIADELIGIVESSTLESDDSEDQDEDSDGEGADDVEGGDGDAGGAV